MIPKNAPVRLLNAQLEELEYGKLYEAYSSKGRKSAADPRVLFKVLVYGYLCGIYSSRKLEEACQYRIDFRWLLEDRKAPDHCTFARFRTGRCRDALEDLFYQLVQRLEDIGETDHTAVFIDGTKLESCAGRYTFVWRKSVEKQLTKVKEEIRRETGLTSPLDLQAYLDDLAAGISFVHGSGKRKSGEQRVWEKLHTLLERWQKYEGQLSTMGEGRNSYSKTDEDATFMRMKEDHMRNGQLKPGYNVQLAVNSEYITGIEAFSDRSDVKTLKPFLQRLEEFHHTRYEEVVADAGYESLENYLYLDSTDQVCFIKPTNYDQKKSKKFQKQIGRVENMAYDPEEAVRILEEAGWMLGEDGVRIKDGVRAAFTVMYQPDDSVRQALAEDLANQCALLGIEVTTQGAGWDVAYTNALSQPLVWGWGAHTPMELYNIYHTAGETDRAEYSPYSNSTVDAYMDEALRADDLEESYELWQKAQWDGSTGVTQEGDIPWIWLCNVDHLYYVRDGLQIAEQKIHPHGHGWSLVNNVDQWEWRQ